MEPNALSKTELRFCRAMSTGAGHSCDRPYPVWQTVEPVPKVHVIECGRRLSQRIRPCGKVKGGRNRLQLWNVVNIAQETSPTGLRDLRLRRSNSLCGVVVIIIRALPSPSMRRSTPNLPPTAVLTSHSGALAPTLAWRMGGTLSLGIGTAMVPFVLRLHIRSRKARVAVAARKRLVPGVCG